MRKDMLKKLPFNLWWCSTTFFGVLFITTFIPQLELLPTILICLFVYLKDVVNECELQVLQDRIDKLENKE